MSMLYDYLSIAGRIVLELINSRAATNTSINFLIPDMIYALVDEVNEFVQAKLSSEFMCRLNLHRHRSNRTKSVEHEVGAFCSYIYISIPRLPLHQPRKVRTEDVRRSFPFRIWRLRNLVLNNVPR